MVLSGRSGDFGPLKNQEEILPLITEKLRIFLRERDFSVKEIVTYGLDG